ncbi:MAG: Acyl-CoA dehydrogenase [Sphingomonas bacterium]|uniref:acyl-CoA dehydrogenase family protein n=1 Tax=Sphingomonas bacterium TaxID=1895847 RepID=UPI002611ECDB|nr:acyl-CoA dehydrogenase [Sphingomonas bacterium]MDB5694608.1 Acyl-CoA dehydrogenase [Sphingomonas bacterium]
MAEPSELQMLRDSARRLAADCAPARWSSAGRTGRSDPARWARMIENGWLHAGLDEKLGGFGFGAAEAALIAQEAGRGLLAEPLLANYVALSLLVEAADTELGGQVAEAVREGRQKLAFAYAEPGARFAWEHPAAHVRREGNAAVLDGRKQVVLGVADADLIVTVARDEAGELVVLLVPAAAPGVEVQGFALVDGTGAGDIRFSGVRLQQEALLARGETARAAIERALDHGATLVCAGAVGAMRAAFEMTLDYVKNRVQFGEPIGRNQALQHRLVDLLRLIRESEILLAEAVAAMDGDRVERGLAVSAAKLHINAAARKVGQEAVQMHGAIGTTDEAAISHYFRALTAMGVLFGDAAHHRARFFALDRQLVAQDTRCPS